MQDMIANKKPLVIVLAVGLLVILGLFIYGILVSPARQPYRDALTQYTHVNTALTQTNIPINASTASDQEFEQSITALRTAFNSLAIENDALAQEAVLKEGEGKELYAAYNKDLRAFMTYNVDVITSIEQIRPVIHDCKGDFSTITPSVESVKTLRACATALRALTDIPDADYKQLAADFHASYDQLADIYERAQRIEVTSKTAIEKELNEASSQAAEDFSEAGVTFAQNVQKKRKALLNTDSANKLKAYLEDKARIF